MRISINGSPPIFLDNKYARWYRELIASRQPRSYIDEYTERHHIWPRGLGGPDIRENLVALTDREHFIAHHLLTKMTTGNGYRGMCCALVWFMADNGHTRNLTARQYAIAKKAVRILHPFFILDGDTYIQHIDFYRFCTVYKMGRAVIQAGRC
jgi:hypothetical protein